MNRPVLLLGILLVFVCAACTPSSSSSAPVTLPDGNAEAGDALFHKKLGGLPECSSCHSLDGTRGTGPTLLGYGEVAGTRRQGEDATTYTVNSILHPNAYLLPGFSGLMPASYGQLLSKQELADLVAYVLRQ